MLEWNFTSRRLWDIHTEVDAENWCRIHASKQFCTTELTCTFFTYFKIGHTVFIFILTQFPFALPLLNIYIIVCCFVPTDHSQFLIYVNVNNGNSDSQAWQHDNYVDDCWWLNNVFISRPRFTVTPPPLTVACPHFSISLIVTRSRKVVTKGHKRWLLNLLSEITLSITKHPGKHSRFVFVTHLFISQAFLIHHFLQLLLPEKTITTIL